MSNKIIIEMPTSVSLTNVDIGTWHFIIHIIIQFMNGVRKIMIRISTLFKQSLCRISSIKYRLPLIAFIYNKLTNIQNEYIDMSVINYIDIFKHGFFCQLF